MKRQKTKLKLGLRKLVAIVLLLLVVSSARLFAEQSFIITESQLNEIENLNTQNKKIISEQQTQLEELKKALANLETTHRELQKSYKKLENKNLIKGLTIGFSVGLASGIVGFYFLTVQIAK